LTFDDPEKIFDGDMMTPAPQETHDNVVIPLNA
jgi:hypothetical protein